jgi:predicted DNA-binding transcriptional regulator AlpA
MSATNPRPCRTPTGTLKTAEAATMLGIKPATLRGWKAQHIGPPFIQLSARCVRYHERDIEQYVNERRVVPCVRETGRRH